MKFVDQIVTGLGGVANIVESEPCATRLLVEVFDRSKVDTAKLRTAGASTILLFGNSVQLSVGTRAEAIVRGINERMEADGRVAASLTASGIGG